MKNIFSTTLLSFIVTAASCSGDNDIIETGSIAGQTAFDVDAHCQDVGVTIKATGRWTAVSDAEWLTVTTPSGAGDATLPLYVQQNDGDIARRATVSVTFADGTTQDVSVAQLPNDDNAPLAYVPQSFGVGWGYDASADYGDVAGLRGQVIDVAKLNNITGWDDGVEFVNSTSSYYEMTAQTSTTELCNYLSTKLTGEVDLKIAGAKVSAEFEKQVTETANRYYLWYRNIYKVKECYFTVDMFDPTVIPYSLTLDFKNAIYKLTPEQFVQRYGTHIITSSSLGGKLDYYMTVSQDIKETVERITLTISVRFLCWSTSATHVDESLWQSIQQSLTGRYYCSGGGAKGRELSALLDRTVNQGQPTMPDGSRCTLFTEWAQCFSNPNTVDNNDLAIVAVQVTPIADIVSLISPTKAAAIEKYVNGTYLK